MKPAPERETPGRGACQASEPSWKVQATILASPLDVAKTPDWRFALLPQAEQEVAVRSRAKALGQALSRVETVVGVYWVLRPIGRPRGPGDVPVKVPDLVSAWAACSQLSSGRHHTRRMRHVEEQTLLHGLVGRERRKVKSVIKSQRRAWRAQ